MLLLLWRRRRVCFEALFLGVFLFVVNHGGGWHARLFLFESKNYSRAGWSFLAGIA